MTVSACLFQRHVCPRSSIGWIGGVLPLGPSFALAALELPVAFLQVYVFTILSCISMPSIPATDVRPRCLRFHRLQAIAASLDCWISARPRLMQLGGKRRTGLDARTNGN